MIKVHTIQVGSAKSNCYIIYNDNSESIIIDAGDNAPQISDFLKSNQLKPIAILATHAHYDHISAVSELKLKFDVPFYMHHADAKLVSQVNMYRHFIANEPLVKIPIVDNFYKNNETLNFGNIKVKIIHTGIHTAGHCCLLINNALFTGDILYKGRIDNTINQNLVMDQYDDLLNRICKLPVMTQIYPGHGQPGNIPEVLKLNIELKELIRDECEHKTSCI